MEYEEVLNKSFGLELGKRDVQDFISEISVFQLSLQYATKLKVNKTVTEEPRFRSGLFSVCATGGCATRMLGETHHPNCNPAKFFFSRKCFDWKTETGR